MYTCCSEVGLANAVSSVLLKSRPLIWDFPERF